MTSVSTDRRLGVNGGMAIKVPCRVATTANITLSGAQTMDGVAVVTDDRVLVKNQTDTTENGIYVADSGDWSRAPDCDGANDLVFGSLVKVNLGTAGSGFYYCSTTGTIVVGTTAIAFSLASTALAVVSAFMQTVLDDTTAAAARATLGVPSTAEAVLQTLADAKGDTIVATANDTWAKKSAPTTGYVRLADSAQADGWQDVPSIAGMKNRLINPSGRIYQRAVAATADDTYFADRWNMLTQTNTVTPSVLSDPEDGYPKGIRITQSQAVAQRFGFSQIIEGANCKDLRGQSGVLVPRVRISNSQAIRYAILGWTGTEDTVTSDVVNDWTSAVYTAGNFFLAASVSVLVVGAQTPAANTWTSLAALTAALGSTFNNIIVFVWTEATAAQNVTLDFDYVQFERGSVATEFERRALAQVITLCQRHYHKTYNIDVAPATVTTAGEMRTVPPTAAGEAFGRTIFPVPMFAAPTLTFYSAATGASGNIRDYTGGADAAQTAANVVGMSGYSGFSNAPTADRVYGWHHTAIAEL